MTALTLLRRYGGVDSIRMLVLLAATGWIVTSLLTQRYFLLSVLSWCLLLAWLVKGSHWYRLDYERVDSRHNSLAKELQGKWRDENGKKDETPSTLLDSGWNEYGRVDVIGNLSDDTLYAYINSRSPAWMLRFDGHLADVRESHANALVAYPMIVRQPQKVLSLGSGAGYDTLMALAFGAREVDAVEINPLLVEIVKRLGDYSGRVYDNDKVHLFTEEARNFVRRTNKIYDLIYISLVQTALPEIYEMSLTENYVYTVEAFQEYLRHLSPNGMIAVWVHDDGLMARTVLTALEALQREGVNYPANTSHIIVLWATEKKENYSFLIMLSRNPFTLEEQERVLVPDSFPKWMPISKQVMNIQNARQAEMLLRERIDSAEHPDIKPVYDDRPFFFNVHGLYPRVLRSLTLEITVGLFLMMVIALVKGFKPPDDVVPAWRRYAAWPAYFALLGIGFMLIEVSLMQRFLLWLGSPVYAFSLLLFSLLAGAAIGSIVSGKIQRGSPSILVFSCTALIALLALVGIGFALPKLFEMTLAWPYGIRFGVAALFTAIFGIPMGMPFPVGLAEIRNLKLKGIPWAWGINGVASVLGSLLAVLFSQIYGISGIALFGVVCYILAGFIFRLADVKPEIPGLEGSSNQSIDRVCDAHEGYAKKRDDR